MDLLRGILPLRMEPVTREGLPRHWEIDSLRGAALINLVAFHILFDLYYFGDLELDLSGGPWFWYTRLSASVFIILVGVSLTLSRSSVSRVSGGRRWLLENTVRGMIILAWGGLITLMTWFAVPDDVIVFGILHLIGVSIILAPVLMRVGPVAGATGGVMVFVGIVLYRMRADHPWLVWLGIRPERFTTVDYFPLLPWLGVVMMGICIGQRAYPEGRRRFRVPDVSRSPPIRALSFLGRNTLPIYLLHQPIVLGVLHTLGYIDLAGGLSLIP